jgi:hypothetical protein
MDVTRGAPVWLSTMPRGTRRFDLRNALYLALWRDMLRRMENRAYSPGREREREREGARFRFTVQLTRLLRVRALLIPGDRL